MSQSVDKFAKIPSWVEDKIEEWMGLAINRDKTKVIDTTKSGTTLDFLGYSFRYDKSRYPGTSHRYWNRIPSKKSVKRFNARVTRDNFQGMYTSR